MDNASPLPGLSPTELVATAEQVQLIGNTGMDMCFQKCIKFFGEDSIPYHPGEKTCMDRCTAKLADSYYMAKTIRRQFEDDLKIGQMPPWVEAVAAKADKK